jgi:hypothetical protein
MEWCGGGCPESKAYVRLVEFCLIYAFTESRRRYFRDQRLLYQDVTDQHIIRNFDDRLKNYSYLQILSHHLSAFSWSSPFPIVDFERGINSLLAAMLSHTHTHTPSPR